MVIKHFVNRKTGLSTDTKPLPANLSNVIYIETDTGTYSTSDGTTTTAFQGPQRATSPTGKTINAEKNAIDLDSIEDFPFSQVSKTKGGIIPAATVQDSFYGIMSGMTLYNDNKPLIQSGLGLLIEFRTPLTSAIIGYSSPVPMARRGDQDSIKAEIKATSSRVLVGFSTASQFDASLGLGDSDKGVVIGFTKAESNFSVFNNDGSGPRNVTSFPIPKDQGLHTFEILLNLNNIVCRIDGGNDVIITSQIPGLTDDMYLICYGIN